MGRKRRADGEPSGRAAAGGEPERLGVYATLLGAVFLLTFLIASGLVRFGLEGPIVYVLYVLAGLLAAVLCYGLLESTGELHGKRYSVTLRLGGAIVGLVVVTGGGGFYERYLRTPSVFSVRASFSLTGSSSPTAIDGDAILEYRDRRHIAPIDRFGSALFQGITSDLRGAKAVISLSSKEFQIRPEARDVTLSDDNPLTIHVTRAPLFVEESAASIDVRNAGARSSKMAPGFAFGRSMSFLLRAVCQSDKPFPVDPHALLEIATVDGLPVAQQELKVYSALQGDGATLEPKTPTPLMLEGPMYATVERAVDRDNVATIVLYYDVSAGGTRRRFALKSFLFTRDALGYDEDLSLPCNERSLDDESMLDPLTPPTGKPQFTDMGAFVRSDRLDWLKVTECCMYERAKEFAKSQPGESGWRLPTPDEVSKLRELIRANSIEHHRGDRIW